MPFVAHRIFGWKPWTVGREFKTLKAGMAYPLCNTLRCRGCGMLFLDMRFDADEMARLYSGYRDSDYVHLRAKYEPGYGRRNAELGKPLHYAKATEQYIGHYLPAVPPRILDWGGGTGINTPFRSRSEVDIFDISGASAAGATRINRVRRKYPLVTCLNVLEHTPYPDGELAKLQDAMDRTSVLFIEVPHEVTIKRRKPWRTKRHWHEHVNFYSEKSLRSLLRRAGFRALNLRSLDVSRGGREEHVFQLVARCV